MNILQFLIDIRSRDNGVIGQVTRMQERLDAADRSANRLSTTIGGRLRTAIMSLPGAEFFTNPIVALTAGVGVVSKLGMDADKTAVSFNVLTGSMEKGTTLLGQINKYADETIYDRLGTQEAAKTMLGFGVSLENVMGDLKMLGDVAMGDKNRMSQLALVFGQVAAAGKLQGQDLLQLINAGYNPLLDMSALTGKSVGELRDEMSKGNISFEMLRQAFQRATGEGGKFYNMTNEIAKTPFGRWQQLLGEFNQKLLEMYQIIQPALIPAMDGLSAILRITTPIIKGLSGMVVWIGNNMDWLLSIVIPLTAAWAGYNTYMFISTGILKGWTIAQWAQVTALIAAEKAQKLLNIAMSMNPIGLIVAGVLALASAVVYCWNKFAGFRAFIYTAWDTIKGFGEAIGTFLVDRFWDIVEGIGAVGKALVKLVKGDFEGAWKTANEATRKLVGGESVNKLIQSGAKTVKNTTVWYNEYSRREQSRQKAKEAAISDPEAMAGTSPSGAGTNGTPGTVPASDGGKANEITAGGTRNTQITVNITKFFDYLNVTMMDKTDTTELQRVMLEAMNRSLETAMSSAR